MNTPDKIIYFTGPRVLKFLMNQERSHWLLKTDKNKQSQDDVTGDIFKGQVDNRGSSVVAKTEKSQYKSSTIELISFVPNDINKIVSPAYSAFTYSAEVNGLMFGRIISIEYPYQGVYKNYRIYFSGAEEVIIPFGAGDNTSDVYPTKWIRTTTPPKIQMLSDETATWTIEQSITLPTDIHNAVWYYPLDSNMHALEIHRLASSTYASDPVNDNELIGYPLFWFTCDASEIGPHTTISNNTSTGGSQLSYLGNEGNKNSYESHLYVGVDGNMDATPDDSSTTGWVLSVHSTQLSPFDGTDADYLRAIDKSTIEFVNTTTSETQRIVFDNPDVITGVLMNNTLPWTYVSSSQYTIALSDFDANCAALSQNALIPALDIFFDTHIPFGILNDSDLGYAGIEMTSSQETDQARYPYQLNEWDGIPEWMNGLNTDRLTPQHTALYAIHNTPFYNSSDPQSRQVAALLLDPGKQVEDSTYHDLEEDEKGRIYVLSNDPIEYENNATAEHPKPERTVARICDIPTSIAQFINVSGLAPVSVVDEDYVRTEIPFYEQDAERLYNILGPRVVVPTMVNSNHIPINVASSASQDNPYIFNSFELLCKVNLLMPENDTRTYVNLAPVVDPSTLTAYIATGGTGYAVGDHGVVFIGGAAMEYDVVAATPIESNSGGTVTEVNVYPHDERDISLSNFKMRAQETGYTATFGTSKSNGDGEGLQIYFYIENYDSIKTRQDKIRQNLIAFVKEDNGLYLYTYYLNPNTAYGEYYGEDEESEDWSKGWEKAHTITQYEISDTAKYKYDSNNKIIGTTSGTSSKDAYLNTTLPSFRPVACNRENDDIEKEIPLKTISTSSMINIIDTDCTPITETLDTDQIHVDITGFRVTRAKKMNATSKTTEGVLSALKKAYDGVYDSYLVWRWTEPASVTSLEFEYAFIYNTFSNILNDDVNTYIPMNDLKYNSYVNTNPNTTVLWDIKGVGPMMWIYSPTYMKKEKYHVDLSTRDVFMTFSHETGMSMMEWSDFVVETDNGPVPVVSASGTLNWYLMSNRLGDNPSYEPSGTDPIYQSPEYGFIGSSQTSDGSIINANITDFSSPKGNWRLVFPRIHSYTLKTVQSGTVHKEVQLRMLQAIKGKNLNKTSIDSVKDSEGNIINGKCVIFNETQSGTQMIMYNPETSKWESI